MIDPASGLCRGCARTLDEIAQWPSLSHAEQQVLMALLPKRLAAAGLAPTGDPSPS